jgi:hypothetical protein
MSGVPSVTVICRSNRRAPGSLTASFGGGADPVDGPLRTTARLSAIGTFARSTHARQANRFAERRDRGSAETVPSSSRRALPGRNLQFTNPFISSPTTKTP